ncbi:MAG: cytochrome P450 [Acidimicrobiia bacterium]
MALDTPLDAIDLTDLDRFADGFPHAMFTRLRREAPVWWQAPTEHTPGAEGFWAVTRHADLLRVVRDPATFSSETGPGRDGAGGTILEDLAPGVGPGVMLNMCDPPTHTRIRGLVSRDFTAKPIERLVPFLRARTARILDDVAARGTCDFLVDVAAELPLQTIARILGVPESDSHQLFAWTSTILDFRDRELEGTTDELADAALGMVAYGADLIDEKRRSPSDDMLSAVIHATLEGAGGEVEALTPAETSAFFSLLFVAGSETTRNSIAGGVLALIEFPDQLAALRADRSLVSTAVEEILRWTSATAYNRRTATRDVELGGQLIRAGEKTTHWYPSANRDDAVFADPFRFDVARDPNPHLAFGGGLHHCLGAALARTEVRVMLEALLERFSGFALAGPVEWGRSNKHTSIRHLPITLQPA